MQQIKITSTTAKTLIALTIQHEAIKQEINSLLKDKAIALAEDNETGFRNFYQRIADLEGAVIEIQGRIKEIAGVIIVSEDCGIGSDYDIIIIGDDAG